MTNKDDFKNSIYNRTLSMDGVLRFWDIYSVKSQATRTFTKDSTTQYETTGFNMNVDRFGPHFFNSIWYNDFPDDFVAQSGIMWDVIGYREIGTHNEFHLRRPIKGLNEIALKGGVKGRFNYNNELEEDYFWAKAEASLNSVWTECTFFKNHELYNDIDFEYSGCEIELWNSPVHFVDHFISVYIGGAAQYYEGFTGLKNRVLYNVTLKPLSKLVCTSSISREDFYYDYEGERCYLQTVVWNKLSYQIIPAMFVRGIYQYSSLDRNSAISLLFAYEYSPLSNIYLGSNLNDIADIDQISDNIEIFAKIGYLWRL